MAEEKEKPLTREDMLRLIEENGGTAEKLDLSGKVFEERIDLSGFNREDLNLSGIKLNNTHLFRANFNGSNLDRAIMQNTYLGYATFNPLESKAASLQGIDLRGANLHNAEFRGADITAAQFQGVPIILSDQSQAAQFRGMLWEILPARLEGTDFRDATLFRANFEGCYFYGTKLEGAFIRGADIIDAHLGDADWGNYIIGEEKKKDFYSAEHRYRQLKAWYTQSGYGSIAAKFYYREKEANRKALKWRSKSDFRHRLALELSYLIFGHGEGWKRILFWITGFILAFTLVYFVIGTFIPNLGTLTPNTLLNSLYYSAISFTALGYGSWAPEPTGWVKGLGAFEALLGVSMMALLLVTFVRKWTR